MTDKKKRRVFVHAHIPKSGGTTFGGILNNNFGAGYMRGRTLISSFQIDPENIAKGIQESPFLRAFSAHHISLDLPYEMEDVVITGISFVRDPVARFISHYFAHRHLSPKSTVPETRTMNFRDYLESSLVQGKQQAYMDGQVKFLSGRKIVTGQKNLIKNDKIDEFSLEKIVDLINKRKALVFPLSRFDEGCIVLERMFPKDLKDCSYPKAKNVSPRDQFVTEEDREIIAKHVGKLDYQLLEVANKLLDELIEEIFADHNQFLIALRNFERRCRTAQIREIFFPFYYAVKNFRSVLFG